MPVTIGSVATGTLSGTNLTISKPSGTVSGDLLVASIGGIFSATQPNTPTGWTRENNSFIADSNSQVYFRTATGSDPSSWTWVTGGGSGDVGAGSIIRFTGSIDQVNPFRRAEIFLPGGGSTYVASSFHPDDLNSHVSLGSVVNPVDACMYTMFIENPDNISNTGSSSWSGAGWTLAQKYDSYWVPGGVDYTQITVYANGHPSSTPSFTQTNTYGAGELQPYGLAVANVSGYAGAGLVSFGAQNAGRLFAAGQKMRASYTSHSVDNILRAVDNPAGALIPGTHLRASQA